MVVGTSGAGVAVGRRRRLGGPGDGGVLECGVVERVLKLGLQGLVRLRPANREGEVHSGYNVSGVILERIQARSRTGSRGIYMLV